MFRESMPSRSLAVGLAAGVLAFTFLCGCSGDAAGPGGADITGEISANIDVDDGYVGLVIDAREIFRKGYIAKTASVTFRDYPKFDTTLDIDPTTSLAILSIDTDSLTEAELAAFASGVVATCVVYDAGQVALATMDDDALVLDNSNAPMGISTGMPWVEPPLALKSDLPYLVQVEGRNGVLARRDNYKDEYLDDDSEFRQDDPYDGSQQFHFLPVPGAGENTFSVESRCLGRCYWGDGTLNVREGASGRWLEFEFGFPLAELVLEQDEDGWVKMRLRDTDEYVVHKYFQGERSLVLSSTEEPGRFRLISNNIAWQVDDRGTVFEQPIMPPVKLDFAYKATLRNCSSATLEETIGRTERRTRTTAIGTSESFELFNSAELSLSVKVGFSVKAKVGVDVQGIGEAGTESTTSQEITVGAKYTTAFTYNWGNTWSESESVTEEVSRTRTLTLQPFTGVEAYDAVKTVENVPVPFTQTLRIRATDKDDDSVLSGDEIQSQMLFNFVGGVISAVGDDYIDISFRGYATIDKLFKATTNVTELQGTCD